MVQAQVQFIECQHLERGGEGERGGGGRWREREREGRQREREGKEREKEGREREREREREEDCSTHTHGTAKCAELQGAVMSPVGLSELPLQLDHCLPPMYQGGKQKVIIIEHGTRL